MKTYLFRLVETGREAFRASTAKTEDEARRICSANYDWDLVSSSDGCASYSRLWDPDVPESGIARR